MSAASELPDVAERGVYFLPWYGTLGEVWIVAVDRHGCKLGEATVLPGQSPRSTERLLWALLDREDPSDGVPVSPPQCGLSVVR
jgi:hypothetical protein